MVSMGAPLHTLEYVNDRSTHSGMLRDVLACRGARDASPISRLPGAAIGFTYVDTCDVTVGMHVLLTVADARAQCDANAIRTPSLDTLIMPVKGAFTSNCAKSWIGMPRFELSWASEYVQLMPAALNVANILIFDDATNVSATVDAISLAGRAVSEMAKAWDELSPLTLTL